MLRVHRVVDARNLRAAALVALLFAAATCRAEPDVVADPAFVVRITEPAQAAALESESLETIHGEGFDALVELAEVQVAIAVIDGESCRWLERSDTGFPRLAAAKSDCDRPTWFRATRRGSRWTFPLEEPLPPGNYRVLVRGKDRDGNIGASDGVVFRLT
jgi:hypothetical protein